MATSGNFAVRLAMAAVGYLGLQQVGLWLAFPPAQIAAYWPAAGFGAAVMAVATSLDRRWYATVIFAVNLAGNLGHGNTVALSAGFAVANTIEAYAAGRLVGSALGRFRADPLRQLGRGLLPAALGMPAIAATVAAVVLAMTGSPLHDLGPIWWTWCSSDTLGILSVLPGALVLLAGGRLRIPRRQMWEVAAVVVLQSVVILLVFARPVTLPAWQEAYWVIPGLFWVVARFGPHGTALLTAGQTTLIIGLTAHGGGPFARYNDLGDRMLSAQTFCAVMLVSAMLLTHIIAAHRAAERAAHRRALNAIEARSRELERSNRDLEEFAYIASHDLQEPVRNITTYAELLAEHSGEQLDPTGTKYLRDLLGSAQRMHSMIIDLLDYARAGAGNHSTEQVDLTRLVADVAADLGTTTTGAVIDATDLPVVTGYRQPLQQILRNLIANAIKFRADAPPHIRITAHRTDGQWEISVADNGIGVDPRHTDQIFGMFRRLHSRTAYPGSGVGLALVRRLVERGGGTIACHPRPDGTTFTFTLPEPAGESALTHAGAGRGRP